MVPGDKRVYEWSQHTKDSRVVLVEISSNFVVLDGRGYNVSFVRDITEQRRADDHFVIELHVFIRRSGSRVSEASCATCRPTMSR